MSKVLTDYLLLGVSVIAGIFFLRDTVAHWPNWRSWVEGLAFIAMCSAWLLNCPSVGEIAPTLAIEMRLAIGRTRQFAQHLQTAPPLRKSSGDQSDVPLITAGVRTRRATCCADRRAAPSAAARARFYSTRAGPAWTSGGSRSQLVCARIR